VAEISYFAVLCAALAFFAVGVVWYGGLFAKLWQRASGLSEAEYTGGNKALIFGGTFVAELAIAWVLGHQFAMTDASDRAIMMISTGFGALVMAPAIGIVYLHLRKSFTLWLIDAGHFVVGMAAMGAVFIALT